MRRCGHAAAVGALLASASCSFTSHGTYGGDASMTETPEASTDAGAEASTLAIPSACAGLLSPPPTLDCTGLYTDVATHTLAPQVRAYAPAVPLWADGSGKDRWLYLPPGTQINTTDPSNWTFPVGTRVWKQFSRDNVRIETRYFYKLPSSIWAYGTYQWSADQTSAKLAPGGDIALAGDGGTYHIPTIAECQQCHGGSADRLLGVSQVALGLAGATGLTLDEMVKENLLTPVPARTKLEIGDDGTGLAAAPLGWMHINCGMACHNTNPSALGASFGMILKLDPAELDGRASNDFPSILTTVGVLATNPAYAGQTRIVAGNPTASLLHQLIDERGSIQMPPIASLLVDTPDVAAVASWIAAMPPAAPLPPGTDAGADTGTDARADASYDAGKHDGGKHDAGSHDASYADASPEAGPSEDARGDGSAYADGATPDGSAHADGDLTGDARAE